MAARPSPAAKKPASTVPLPAYARPPPPKATSSASGSGGAKLMSLNSKIMAAQREWETKYQADDNGDDDDLGSDASESTEATDSSLISISDDADLPPGVSRSGPTTLTRAVASVRGVKPSVSTRPAGRVAGPVAGVKRPGHKSIMWEKSQKSRRLMSHALTASLDPPSTSGQPPPVQQDPKELNNLQARVASKRMLTYSAYDSITNRADGMLYEYYRVSKLRIRSMRGAIVPTNYRLSKHSPDRRYECPDRFCFKAFDNERSLGGHFSAAHKGNAYNDNCDGTLTKVGTYARLPGESYRAIVVSRISVNGSEEELWQNGCSPVPFTASHVALTHPDPFTYVTSFLDASVDHTKKLSIGYIRALCELPKRRDLPRTWSEFHGHLDLSERMFALAVAYVTGTEIFGVDVCFNTIRGQGNRLRQVCVAVPVELSEAHMRAYFTPTSCVACLYYAELHSQVSTCDWQNDYGFISRYVNRVDGCSDSDESDSEFAFSGMGPMMGKRRREARAVDSAIKAGKAAKLTQGLPASSSTTAAAAAANASRKAAAGAATEKRADADERSSEYSPSADGTAHSSEVEGYDAFESASEGEYSVEPSGASEEATAKPVVPPVPQAQTLAQVRAMPSGIVHQPAPQARVDAPGPAKPSPAQARPSPAPAMPSPGIYQPTPPPQLPIQQQAMPSLGTYPPPLPGQMPSQGHAMPSGGMYQPQPLTHQHHQLHGQWQQPAGGWQRPAVEWQPMPMSSMHQQVPPEHLSPQHQPVAPAGPLQPHFTDRGSTEEQTLTTGRTTRSAAAVSRAAAEQPATADSALRPTVSAQTPSDQLQMEPWEVAPGRIIDSTHGENIGYSSSYLNGREPTDVSEDVSFNVVTIKSGDKTRWEVQASQLRTCSVAAGKVEIKMGTNIMSMGPNSMFIIRPGEACLATNKLYIDATIHCTTVKNYSF